MKTGSKRLSMSFFLCLSMPYVGNKHKYIKKQRREVYFLKYDWFIKKIIIQWVFTVPSSSVHTPVSLEHIELVKTRLDESILYA